MKKRPVHLFLAALWLCLVTLLAGYVIAQTIGIKSVPQPLIVKNGPGIHALPEGNGISAAAANHTISVRSAQTGPTNLHLQAMFAVVYQTNGQYFLSNSPATAATNYFDVPAGSGYFTGNQTIPLNSPNQWTGIDFKLKPSEFVSSNRKDSFLLMLGRAQQGTNEYQIAYAYTVHAGTSTNVVTSVHLPETERITVEDKYKFNIWHDTTGSTNVVNMNLQAYLAVVQTNGSNFYLSNVTGNLGTEAFKDEPGLFTGGQPVSLKAGEFTPVSFVLREEYFTTNGYGDYMLIFVGTANDSQNHYETAYIFQVDSPYEANAQTEDKSKKK